MNQSGPNNHYFVTDYMDLDNSDIKLRAIYDCIDYITFCNIYDIPLRKVRDTIYDRYKITLHSDNFYGISGFILWVYENNLIYNDLDSIMTLWQLKEGSGT
jgi:hypothetical protein